MTWVCEYRTDIKPDSAHTVWSVVDNFQNITLIYKNDAGLYSGKFKLLRENNKIDYWNGGPVRFWGGFG